MNNSNEYQEKAINLTANDEAAEAKCTKCGEECPYCLGKMPRENEDDNVNEGYDKMGSKQVNI